MDSFSCPSKPALIKIISGLNLYNLGITFDLITFLYSYGKLFLKPNGIFKIPPGYKLLLISVFVSVPPEYG